MRRLLQYGLEYRLRIARRTVDDRQHFGQRRLSSQRLVAVRGALVKFAPEIGDGLRRTGERILRH